MRSLLNRLPSLSVRGGVTLAFVIISAWVLVQALVSYFQLRQVQPYSDEIIAASQDMLALQRMTAAVGALDAELERYLTIRGLEYKENIQANFAEMEAAVTQLNSSPSAMRRPYLQDLATTLGQIRSELAYVLDAELMTISSGEINRRVVALYNDLELAKEQQENILAETMDELQANADAQGQIADTVLLRSIALSGIVLFTAVLSTLAVNLRLRGITVLTQVSTAVAAGDLTRVAPEGRRDEIGALGVAFNTMTSRLREMLTNLEQRVGDRTRELALAADVGRSVSQLRDLDVLLPNAVELIRAQFNLYYAQIYLVDETGRLLTLRAGTGGVGTELLRRGHRLAVGPGSINGMAAGERRAIIVVDTATSPIFRPNPLLPETRSELAMPLLIGERVVGVLDLQNRHPGALSDENLPVFEALAGQLAIALDNATLFAQTEQARQEVVEQTRRLTRSGWQEFLNALDRQERIGYQYDQANLTSFIEPLPETQAENTVKSPIVITGAQVGAIQLERAGDQPWQAEEMDLVASVMEQASRQLENLRLLAQAEAYRIEAEEAASRLTREGWKEYLQSKRERQGYVYDQTEVQPLETAQSGAADQPANAFVHPLAVGGEKVGELTFDGVAALDEASAEMVSNVADLLSAHIEQLRLSEQTQKALLQTEELYSSSAQVVRSATLDEVLRTVVETTSLRRFDRGTIVFFDQPWEEEVPAYGVIASLWERAGGNSPLPVGTVNPLRHTPFAQVLRRDEPLFIPDVLIDTRLNDQLRGMLAEVGRSLVFYPLIAGEVCFGFLSMAASEPVYMTDEDIRPIQTLAGQAATVMQSIRLLQEAQARAQREQALRQITSAVRGSTNADTILRTATRELGSALGRKVKVQLGSPSQGQA